MEPNQHSRTSLWTAYQRAWHAEHDAPAIFEDGFAGRLVDGMMAELLALVQQFAVALTLPRGARPSLPEAARQLLELAGRIDPAGAEPFPDTVAATKFIMRALLPTSHVMSRARFAKESLTAAARRGVGQYVILGAGMDSFAFRRPVELARVRVIEVDHPATQSFKRRRLGELGWEVPPDVQLVPVDLAEGGLAAALARASFDATSPALFSWLGVTQYLGRDALRATLRAIAEVPGHLRARSCSTTTARACSSTRTRADRSSCRRRSASVSRCEAGSSRRNSPTCWESRAGPGGGPRARRDPGALVLRPERRVAGAAVRAPRAGGGSSEELSRQPAVGSAGRELTPDAQVRGGGLPGLAVPYRSSPPRACPNPLTRLPLHSRTCGV